MTNQKPAYFIFDTKITDMDALAPYLAKAEDTFRAFGGKMIIQGGDLELFEGNVPQGIIVILQFCSMEKARGWYQSEAYQAIVPYRHASAQANAWLVEGLAETITA